MILFFNQLIVNFLLQACGAKVKALIFSYSYLLPFKTENQIQKPAFTLSETKKPVFQNVCFSNIPSFLTSRNKSSFLGVLFSCFRQNFFTLVMSGAFLKTNANLGVPFSMYDHNTCN